MPQNIELRRQAAAEAAKLVFNISIKTPLESVVRVVFLSKVSDFNLDLTSVGWVGARQCGPVSIFNVMFKNLQQCN